MERLQLFIKVLIVTAILWPTSVWADAGDTEDNPLEVSTWDDLKTAMSNGTAYIKLMADCTDPIKDSNSYLSLNQNKTVCLDLNGFMINRGLESSITNGYVIKVNSRCTLTINDSYTGMDRTYTIADGTTITGGLITGGKNNVTNVSGYDHGGGICNLGTLVINNGTIAGNSTDQRGGGVYSCRSTYSVSFTMNGGSIRNNTSNSYGGGIYTSDTFTMNGGSISGNTSTEESGGGIYYVSGEFSLRGGTIENNNCNANKYGGGIYLANNNNNTSIKRRISGAPIVKNNKQGDIDTGNNSNICFKTSNYGYTLTIDATLSADAQIGISFQETYDFKVFTSGLSTYGSSASFFSDDPNLFIVTEDNEAYLMTYWSYIRHRMRYDGGTIQLERDCISSSTSNPLGVPSGKEVVLDLNGYKIDRGGKEYNITNSGTLTIKDTYTGSDRTHTITVDGEPITITGGLITGGNSGANVGGGITNSEGATLTLESGTIAGNTTSEDGGGIYLNNGSTFLMKGGAIRYNTARRGGGIYLWGRQTACSITISGGTIANNIVKNSNCVGGGLATSDSHNSIRISGNPIIKDNINKSDPDNITINNIIFTLNQIINVTDELSEEAEIHIYSNNSVTTNGLNGKGSLSSFISDNERRIFRLDANGEAVYVNAYYITITESENGSVTASSTKGAKDDIITITSTPDDGYYLASLSANSTDILETKQFTITNQDVTITATFAPKASITPTVSLANWVYGNTASMPIVDGNTGNGGVTYLYKVKDADDETYSDTTPTSAGDYTLKATIAETNQHLGATTTTDFTISKRPVTISDIAASNKTYDGTTEATINTANATFTGILGGDALSVSTTGTFADKNVGTGKTVTLGTLTLGGSSISNYELAGSGQQTETTANITPKTLTVTADNATKTYGEENPSFTVNYAGFITEEDESVLTTLPTATCSSAIASSDTGTYDIIPSGGEATNYTFNYVNGTLTINAKTLSDGMVTISNETKVYNGSSQKPTITLEDTDENATITASDYSISNDGSGTNVGTYSIVVTGQGNYTGTVTKSDCFSITPKSIAGVTIADIADQTYTGSAITPATEITDTDISPTSTLTAGTDYTLSYSENNINVTGENVTITITGQGNYDSSTTNSTTFIIVPKALEDGMIAAIDDQTYTGSGIEPELNVTYNGMDLIRNTHYSASFENNISPTGAGTATVTISTCNNNYSGTATANFNIGTASLSTATATGESVTRVYDGTTAFTIPESDIDVKFGSNASLTDDYKVVYRKMYRDDTESLSSITDIGEYTIVIQPKDGNTNVTGELITSYTVNVQLPAYLKECEWVTYYDERFDLATPVGYVAYKITDVSAAGVTAEAIDYIPKGVPVILKTDKSGSKLNTMNILLNEQQTLSSITGNACFVGIPSTETTGVTPLGTVYVLSGSQFVLYEGNDAIPAHRCYLSFGAAGSRSLGINFTGDNTTALEKIEDIDDNPEKWYDLQGRHIKQPRQKGLYINNGKKVVIK